MKKPIISISLDDRFLIYFTLNYAITFGAAERIASLVSASY